jgi:hypothetical protein
VADALPAASAGPAPVTVDPNHGLEDGQSVSVSGTGFTVDSTVDVTLCSTAVFDATGQLRADAGAYCGDVSLVSATVTDGIFETSLTVLRSQPSISGTGSVVCGAQPLDCVVLAVQVNQFGKGTYGDAVVSFVGSPSQPVDCKRQGFHDLVDHAGNSFRNQGQCVAWAVKHA